MPLEVLKYSPTNCLFVLRLTAKDGGTMVPAAPGKSIVVKVPGAGAWAQAVGTPAKTRLSARDANAKLRFLSLFPLLVFMDSSSRMAILLNGPRSRGAGGVLVYNEDLSLPVL
jgi:hypothetical protein